MSCERWIWVELIGFDNTKPDCGAREYLDRIGFVPEGISILFGAVDFVLLHNNDAKEYELFPDFCSRQGHEYNEDRHRQVWQSSQLKTLISELQKYGVKMFFTISMVNLHNEFHEEWCSRFGMRASLTTRPEGIDTCKLFSEKLQQVLTYYNFDGYHISDGVIPDHNITDEGISIYNIVLNEFNEAVGGKIPAEMLTVEYDSSFETRRERGRFIWKNLHDEWFKFVLERWKKIFLTVTAAVHDCGKLVMMNSVAAKGIFETLLFTGFDMRWLNGNVDILVVESVATSMALVTGNFDKLFDFSAITMEMRAVLSELKIINLTGCKDVVESFDSVRNAPCLLERDIYALANTFFNGRRCSDGVMFCLGDGITSEQWKTLEKWREQSCGFPAKAADGWTLYLDKSLYDSMISDYLVRGTPPSYIYVAELVKKGVEIFNVTTVIDDDTPLFVPNFNFLDEASQKKIRERKGISVIIEDEKDGIFCEILSDSLVVYSLGASVSDDDFDSFTRFDLYNERIPLREIPAEFLTQLADTMRNYPSLVSPLNNPEENFFSSVRNGKKRRCAIFSKKEYYTVADCTLNDAENAQLDKISSFPVHDLMLKNNKLVCRKALSTADYYGALRVPPRGVFIFDVTEKE